MQITRNALNNILLNAAKEAGFSVATYESMLDAVNSTQELCFNSFGFSRGPGCPLTVWFGDSQTAAEQSLAHEDLRHFRDAFDEKMAHYFEMPLKLAKEYRVTIT